MLDDGKLGATRYRFFLILVLFKHYRQFYLIVFETNLNVRKIAQANK